ncbi:MAG: FKBP-type peptidyl-prolyl cis-trans isomerase [Candidatus Paceibacteria bacterium]
MFTKFEIMGIAASICAMILALYLVTLETNILTNTTGQSQMAAVPQGLVVVDSTGPSSENALREALTNSAGATGALQNLVANDVRFGIGEPVKKGDTVVVHYIGTLQDGYEFDNSHKRGSPYTFKVGEGKVVKGLEDGIVGMKVGGARILVIPPHLGYGKDGFGPVPGNTPMVFSIELLEIK